jgi:hypothetical protein
LQPSQFGHQQLQMFATPHEAKNWASGDTGWLMSATAESGVKNDAYMSGPIEHPVVLRHLGSQSKVLDNGNHRVVHALHNNQLIPVLHTDERVIGEMSDADRKVRNDSITLDRKWRHRSSWDDE